MTSPRDEVVNDPNYRLVLDHGFIGVKDVMGNDAAIVEAARLSYGKGTKSVSEDRSLIRYLMRNKHTSCIEMAEVKFRVRAPIFVVRQWFRHRSASTNEYSGRYSEIIDEFYFPDAANILPQSVENKQGRAGEIKDRSKEMVLWLMDAAASHGYDSYQTLLGKRDPKDFHGGEVLYDPYSDGSLDNEFPGIARELARIVLPLNTYTSFIWKQDLHNLLHFLTLRADAHAQYEIRVYAEAILDLIRPLFPATIEAWEDYYRDASHLSRMETALTVELLHSSKSPLEAFNDLVTTAGSEKAFAESRGMSLRELRDWRKTVNF